MGTSLPGEYTSNTHIEKKEKNLTNPIYLQDCNNLYAIHFLNVTPVISVHNCVKLLGKLEPGQLGEGVN